MRPLEVAAAVRYPRPMVKRVLPLLMVAVAVAGCAEAVRGPRVVHYTADRFYIRNVPVVESWPTVTEFELATVVCARTGRWPLREDAYQFNPIDIRYSTFRCVSEAELAAIAPTGG